MLLPMIKTHDSVLKNAIKTISVFVYMTPVFGGCDVMIWTKFYKNSNISINTNGKLTKSVSNFGNLITHLMNSVCNLLGLKWKYRLVGNLGEF